MADEQRRESEASRLQAELAQVKAELARVQADLRRTEIVLAEERRANLDFRARAETAGQLAEQRTEIAGQFADLREQLAKQQAEIAERLGGFAGQLVEQRAEIAGQLAGLRSLIHQDIIQDGVGVRGDQVAAIAKEVWWERNRRSLAYKLAKLLKRRTAPL